MEMAMTTKQRQTKNTRLAAMLSVVVFSTITTVFLANIVGQEQLVNNQDVIMSKSTTTPNGVQYTGAPIGAEGRPFPTQPFSVSVNGYADPTIVSVKRGELRQISVDIDQKIPEIVGNVKVYDATSPECATPNPSQQCLSKPLIATLSKDRVSQDESLVLTIDVPEDMKPGVYQYNVLVDTMMTLPDQNEPVKVGYLAAFSIEVL